MNSRFIFLLISVTLIIGCSKNQQTDSTEEDDAWQVLFDGSDLTNWHLYNNEDSVSTYWSIVEGGILRLTPAVTGNRNLVTNKDYTNFILSLEWKISENGNSGIMYGVQEDTALYEPYLTGPEIQVLHNQGHPEGKYPNHNAGSLFDMITPSQDVTKPVGEWNLCVITVNHANNIASVDLNGTRIVEYEPHGENWDAMVANSKYADWERFGKYQTGKIALQDHDDVVYFRNIKIKEL